MMEEEQELLEIQYRLLEQEEIDEIRKELLRSPLIEFAFRYDDPEAGLIEFVYIDEGEDRVGVVTLGDNEPSREDVLSEYAIRVITTLINSDQAKEHADS